MYTIGDLSRRTGVKIPTIRYYEQMGLLAAPERSEGNQRRYEKRELETLAFIRHARDLGLSIEAIRDLLALSEHPERPLRRGGPHRHRASCLRAGKDRPAQKAGA
ncbi:MerR family transcriptional regulator [Sinorhizobium meliloti]|nr:MerR family transcriptional regulator [Sinorhizobium meliloti]